MVIGGYPYTSEVELIDLSGQGQICQQPVNLSIALDGMIGTYINGKILVCGGHDMEGVYYKQCYQYDKAGVSKIMDFSDFLR